MKQNLDISNIESKPTVVVVSNQGEFEPIKLDVKPQIIEEGKFYYFGKSRKKYKCIKANSHLRGTYSTFIDSRGYKGIFPNEDIYLDKWKAPKRDRIRIERKKHDELVAERDRYRSLNNEHFIQLYQAVAERDRLKAENKQLKKDHDLSTNHSHEMTALYAKYEQMSNRLRNQRDMASFIAALLLIVSVGFAVAVWIGKLVPVV